ncbi:1211_t:CDS:2 [Ambispora leptoticha]|uniref:1211_t:CDS:1 n=1 Tax=Ambispora leptoticha TaxID=144679 RepID=A0A9N9DZ07_9GLOM|nr:1211_t:CDS:2 [Ambispora leptoticha]
MAIERGGAVIHTTHNDVGLPLSLGNFQEIVNRGHTFVDKTLLIAEFLRTLFKESNILKEEPDLFTGHFCKLPVLYQSFKVGHLIFLVYLSPDYIYVTEVLTTPEKEQFHDIFSQQVAIDPESVLFDLSKYLKITQLGNKANAFFGTLYSSLLKLSTPCIQVSMLTRLGSPRMKLLSSLIIFNQKKQLDGVEKWYDGTWSTWVNTAFQNALGGTNIIRKLFRNASEDFKMRALKLLDDNVVLTPLWDDIHYQELESSDDQSLWTYLYFVGYLTGTHTLDQMCLTIPNIEVGLTNIARSSRSMSWRRSRISTYQRRQPRNTTILADAKSLILEIMSNRESGIGRYDIGIRPTHMSHHKTALIIEHKATSDPDCNISSIDDIN